MKTQIKNQSTLNQKTASGKTASGKTASGKTASGKRKIISAILPKRLLTVILILGLSVIIFTSAGYSQSGWFSQPLPVSGQVQDLKFFDSNTGLIAMWQPTALLRTTNGGYNWNIVLPNQALGEFEIIESNIVYARGSGYATDVFLFRSYDKGLTWDSLPVANAWTGNGISFVNKDTGWVGGTSGGLPYIWRTTNAGVSWVVQSDDTGFGKVFFLKNKVNGEYVGWSIFNYALWKTTNSGMNWAQIQINIGNPSKLFFINANTGWAATTNSVKKTTDGGLNWNAYYMPSDNGIILNQISSFKLINNDTIYGDYGLRQFPNGQLRGVIWISTNGGVNWGFQQPDTSIGKRYTGIDIVNKDTGWSSWIRTNDGGGPIIITGINTQITEVPEIFTLEQNYPNPFNSSTRINFSISEPANITLTLYDLTGKEVIKIYKGEFFMAGNYFIGLDIGKMGLSSGIYIYKMQATGIKGVTVYEQSRKCVYLK